MMPLQSVPREPQASGSDIGEAHPHYNALLMVPPDYFLPTSGKFITKLGWVQLWTDCLRLDYGPDVWVEAVKPRASGQPLSGNLREIALWDAVRETLKYSVKPADMVSDRAWFLELTRQVHKLRFVATGGVFKGVLKSPERETNEDLMLPGEGQTDNQDWELFFDWIKPMGRYLLRGSPLPS